MSIRKDYCIKPIALVRIHPDEVTLSRVKPLCKLACAQIAKLFYDNGLCNEDRRSDKVCILEDYFQLLPMVLCEAVFSEVQQILSTSQHRVYTMYPETMSKKPADQTSFLPWKLLYAHSKVLNLSEMFKEGGGGNEIFQHILETPSDVCNKFSKVILGSCDISSKNLSYTYEVTDSIWKPQLQTFFNKVTDITQLILKYFCDDDTLAMVGRLCKNLNYLEIHLLPETLKDQQLTDDGFDEFIQYQLRHPTLKEINLKECYSQSITSRSIISLSEIPTLHSMHMRSFHLSWISLQICTRKKETFPASKNVKHVSINFFTNGTEVMDTLKNCFDVVPEPRFVQFILELIPLIFNKLESINLDGIHGDLLPLKDETFRFLKNVVTMRVKKVPRLLDLSEHLNRLERLELHYVPFQLNEHSSNFCFPNLTTLLIFKDSFRHSILLTDLSALLQATPALKDLTISHLTIKAKHGDEVVNVNEEELIEMLRSVAHLRNLTRLDLVLGSGNLVTERMLMFLLETCPHLDRLENLLYWNVSHQTLDYQYLASIGLGIHYASRYHWGLHWRGDDGTVYDPELPLDRF